MRSAGLSVETFASGTEFLKSLDTRLPDCVVLDLHMPQMNGFNVQAHLAQKYAALPVIIFTGHDLPDARERAMAGGAISFPSQTSARPHSSWRHFCRDLVRSTRKFQRQIIQQRNNINPKSRNFSGRIAAATAGIPDNQIEKGATASRTNKDPSQ